MDLVNTLLQFVPIGILAAVFGATYVVGRIFNNPKWIVAVPFLLGGALGTLNYFTIFDPAALAQKPLLVNIISALLMGAGYGGAEVLLWEKVAKKLYTEDGIVTPPKQ